MACIVILDQGRGHDDVAELRIRPRADRARGADEGDAHARTNLRWQLDAEVLLLLYYYARTNLRWQLDAEVAIALHERRRAAYIVMAYTVMAYTVVAYIVMAYIVMAYIVMARWRLRCKNGRTLPM